MNISKLTDFKWINIYKATWTDKKNKLKEWFFASGKNPEEQIRSRKASSVCIIPIIQEKGSPDKIVITKEYRAPVDGYEYGMPAGIIEDNEPMLDAVKRELFEETGLELTKIHSISPPVFTGAHGGPGMTCYCFVYCKGTLSNEHQEEDEEIESFALTFEEIKDFISSGEKYFGSRTWLIVDAILKRGKISFE